MSNLTVVAAQGPGEEADSAVHTWVIKNRVAFATLHPAELKRLLFVSTYSAYDPASPAPKGHGYQRDPMESRYAGIGKYYEAHPDLIIPIVVSVRLDDPEQIALFIRLFGEANFEAIKEQWDDGVASVVDGQHRKGGLIWAHEENPSFNPAVPLMLYFGLSYEEEAVLFDTINTTQRKLPKALIEVTKGDITDRDAKTHAQRVREVTFSLARDGDSPWYDQINMTAARDPNRKVTYEGLRRSTANMLPAELIGRIARQYSVEEVAKRYWAMVAEACPAAWNEEPREVYDPDDGEVVEQEVDYRLKDLVGVASVARLGKDIITSALEHPHFEDRMAELISKLSEVDWEKRDSNPWMRSQAGFAGQKEMYTMLYELVYLDKKPGETDE